MMTQPVIICVAPNGARKTKLDHPNLPITASEIAYTAAECYESGASMLHMHIRDDHGFHSLDADEYKRTIKKVRQAVGPDMIIQITTEAVGKYSCDQQIDVVRKVRPEAVSIALRELCPSYSEEAKAGDFFHWMAKESISPQYILYNPEDVRRFDYLRQIGVIPGDHIAVLFVLGAYDPHIAANPADIRPMKDALTTDAVWSVCAFGRRELECVVSAAKLGGHGRVGFENNLYKDTGEKLFSNSSSVRLLKESLEANGHTTATSNMAQNLLNML